MGNKKHARERSRPISHPPYPGPLFWGNTLLRALWARTRVRNPPVVCCPRSSTQPAFEGKLDIPRCCHCHLWRSLCGKKSLGPARSVKLFMMGLCGTWPDSYQPDLSSLPESSLQSFPSVQGELTSYSSLPKASNWLWPSGAHCSKGL